MAATKPATVESSSATQTGVASSVQTSTAGSWAAQEQHRSGVEAVSGAAHAERPAPLWGTGRSRPGSGCPQPCFTSSSVLLKMLFPLDGSVGVPLSITPVRFFQMVLPAIANGPSLSTYTP